jgi:uracil-DNA glycosylase
MMASAAQQQQILRLLDIDCWQRRDLPSTSAAAPSVDGRTDGDTAIVPHDWDALAAVVAGCHHCQALATRRRQTVFGVGDRTARLMVIGEAPGEEEDRRGEPFVGRAGRLLNEMIAAIGLQRSQIYIANMLKCRPPDNRDPAAEEIAACRPYLDAQIALVNPAVILLVGRIAAQAILSAQAPLSSLRGKLHQLATLPAPLVVTYHPAYLLRTPAAKAEAWQDLKLLYRTLLAAGRK